MKKILALILMVALTFNSAFAAWDKADPAGTRNASDIDLYVVANNTALESTLSGITGWKNLAVSYTTAASVTVTADMLLLQAAASIAYRATSVSEVITITTSGASGLVSSLSEASSTWYYVWIARKSSDGTTNGYLSTTTDFTTFLTQVDSGYDQAALVSVVRNNGSSDFISFKQNGDEYFYDSWQTIASGNVGTGAWVSVDVTSFIPSLLSNVGKLQLTAYTSGYATNDSSVSIGAYMRNASGSTVAAGVDLNVFDMNIITANTLYWTSADASAQFRCAGFKLTKI